MILLLDVTEAVEAGNKAYAAVMRKGRQTLGGTQKDRLGDNVIGLVGELIVAKYFNLPWHHEDDKFGQIDVAGKIEVRARRAEIGRDLPYRTNPDKEHPALPYVLVLITSDYNASIPGWLYGHECRARAILRNLRPDPIKGVWYVPGPYRSLGELRALLR